MDARWMLHRDGGELTDELAALLQVERSGLPCNELARRLGRRRGDVLKALRWDPRFEQRGTGRGSRWRTTAAVPRESVWDVLGRKDACSPDPEPIRGTETPRGDDDGGRVRA